ncbi:MAG: hypothetical protein GQF41_1423 [Candidatus Rifleibacterium amylolyticum]|nr:MAG: hypothetical protein GQF41_1423 [Candidatus Rifleibacterium amylolyticum]
MKKITPLLVLWLFLLGIDAAAAFELEENRAKILAVVEEVALKFNYYDEVSASVPNFIKGDSEIGGQCADYALAFINLWNAKYQPKARLVIQQQGIEQFPDGIYEVVGKDTQELPFLKNRTTSMLYAWNNAIGIAHPELGGYKIKLVENVHVNSHHGIKDWNSNGPHVWVKLDSVSVDPTYAEFGSLPVIGQDN